MKDKLVLGPHFTLDPMQIDLTFFGFLKIGNADSSAFENAIKTAQKRPKTSEILAPGSVFPWS